nr:MULTISPECIES: ATP-binding protein [unclassified Enterococcus]
MADNLDQFRERRTTVPPLLLGFGNKKLINALLDRLVHHSKIIQITGPSYRMKSYSENKETK